MTAKDRQRDERWSRYPETVLDFSGDAEVSVDLRREVSPATRNALAVIGLDGEFGIVTAFNPRGVDIGERENSRRMLELEAELVSLGERFVRLDACSPDRSHCECSVAVLSSLERVIEIARRWEQIAVFWWDGSSFWIYGALSDADPIKIRGAENRTRHRERNR